MDDISHDATIDVDTVQEAPLPATLAKKVHELTDELRLTQEEVGEIVGATQRTVARWSAGEATPRPDARRRLVELAYVADEVATVIRPEDVNLWMFAPNRLLDGDTPADRIREGRYKDVLAVIAALADDVVV